MVLQAQKACEQGVPVMARKKDVMGYIAPADTKALLHLLDGSKQLLKKLLGLVFGSWRWDHTECGSCPRLVAAR